MAGESEDLLQPGFFHLVPELLEGKFRPNVFDWYEKHKQELAYASVEQSATENTKGVFKYITEGREEAIQYFEELRDVKPSMNTLANLQWLHKRNSDEWGRVQEELQRLRESSEEIDFARGICERAYFVGFFALGEHHSMEYSKKALQLLEEGIRRGRQHGMNSDEISIWNYYIFKLQKYVFVAKTWNKGGAQCKQHFDSTMSAFLEVYYGESEAHPFYKASALLEVAEMFSFDRKHIGKYHLEDILKDIWDDLETACDNALRMCSTDYTLLLKASRVYSMNKKWDKAKSCIEKLKPTIGVRNSKMAMCLKMARESRYHDMDSLLEAYQCGKQIEEVFHTGNSTTYIEMCDICLQLALHWDKVPQMVKPDREEYLNETIEYGKKAMSREGFKENPRLYACLATCYGLQENSQKELEYWPKAAELEGPGKCWHIRSYLKALSRMYEQQQTGNMVTKAVDAMKKACQKHPGGTVLEIQKQFKRECNHGFVQSVMSGLEQQ